MKIDTMTPEEIIIAINLVIFGPFERVQKTNVNGMVYVMRDGQWSIIPDYLRDLNASFKAIHWLRDTHGILINIFPQSDGSWQLQYGHPIRQGIHNWVGYANGWNLYLLIGDAFLQTMERLIP